jgi:rhodanese-related sulfurtransferase
MMNLLRIAAFAAALLSLDAPCIAADASIVPEGKETTLGLYLTSEEVPSFLAERHGRSLFVDVRTPPELAATGVATLVDANAPSWLLSGINTKPQLNPDFVAQIERLLAARGLTKDDAVVVMCRTGRRSAQAANLLAQAGFSHVYTVIDGFEGDGEGAGPAMKGWKGNGLPWRYVGASARSN